MPTYDLSVLLWWMWIWWVRLRLVFDCIMSDHLIVVYIYICMCICVWLCQEIEIMLIIRSGFCVCLCPLIRSFQKKLAAFHHPAWSLLPFNRNIMWSVPNATVSEKYVLSVDKSQISTTKNSSCFMFCLETSLSIVWKHIWVYLFQPHHCLSSSGDSCFPWGMCWLK